MKAVVQRVASASVEADGARIAEIGPGTLVLLGVEEKDTERDAEWMAAKLASLRIFGDKEGKMSLGLQEIGGRMLLVSNFTVCGDAAKGRRPSFDRAAPFEEGRRLFEACLAGVRLAGVDVSSGLYGAAMRVSLVNDGPVTLVIESPGGEGKAGSPCAKPEEVEGGAGWP